MAKRKEPKTLAESIQQGREQTPVHAKHSDDVIARTRIEWKGETYQAGPYEIISLYWQRLESAKTCSNQKEICVNCQTFFDDHRVKPTIH